MPDDWQRPTEIAREADDQRCEWSERKLEAEARTQIEAATFSAGAESSGENALEFVAHERPLVDRMQTVAETSCSLPDAKTRRLIDCVRERMCPRLPPFGQDRPNGIGKIRWNNRRVLILTENRAGRKRYLIETLEQAIKVIDGLTSGTRRNEIQRRFNADPTQEPLRILLATNVAREGLNFQAHCTDRFHFDLPWNPKRIEQCSGRIYSVRKARVADCNLSG